MWGYHGDLISSYPLHHHPLPLSYPSLLPLSPPPPPPAWLQTGQRKIKRGKKHFGGSDNDSVRGRGGVGGGRGGRGRGGGGVMLVIGRAACV